MSGPEPGGSSEDLAAIGRVELLKEHRDYRHELAMEFIESPDKFRLMVDSRDSTGLMLVKDRAEDNDE